MEERYDEHGRKLDSNLRPMFDFRDMEKREGIGDPFDDMDRADNDPFERMSNIKDPFRV